MFVIETNDRLHQKYMRLPYCHLFCSVFIPINCHSAEFVAKVNSMQCNPIQFLNELNFLRKIGFEKILLFLGKNDETYFSNKKFNFVGVSCNKKTTLNQ